MPTYQLTSPKTGRVYNVDATAELPDDDIDALVNDLDFEAAREAGVQPGVDPAVLQQGPVGSFLQSIPQTFSKVGSGMIGGAGRILDKASESLSQATGLPKGGDMFQRMADYGDELSTSADLTFPTNPQNPVAGTIGSGAAQGLSLLAGGLAGKALTGSNVAMTAVPAASGFLSGANQGIQTAEQIGVQSPLAQLGTGMAFGGLEVLTERLGGIGSKAGTEALTRAVRQTAGQMLRSSGRAVGSEALEEVLAGRSQAALTRLIASEDPNNPGFTRTGVKLDDLASEIVNLEAMKLEALGGAAGGTVFAGVQALANRQLPNDPTTSPNQTPASPQPPAPGQPGAPAPMAPGAPGAAAVSPLIGIAQRGGAVDVTLPEDTGELTAEEVQDLETGRLGDLETGRRQPILQGVPDRPQQVAPFRESSINEEPIMEGDAITDLRIPRSPQAIAESQRIEAERQQQIATMRMLDARAQGMPLIPDSPSGSRDILDFANENPIYLPPGFSEERNLPEYEKLKEAKLPPYWRQFVASSKRGGNPSDVAQRAFDAGFIDAPTADAYLEALRGGIEGRQQYRVQFAQREKALQQEEKRVVNFEQSQDKLARKRSTERVDFEDIRVGDAMTIDGEPAVVRNIEYDQDGYLTNVVIEDGKRFGLMQFDPQTRGGILVDEFQPRPQRSASTPESAQQESDLTPGFQHLVIDRDLEAGFMSGAGADALIDLAHRAFAAGRTFAQWAAAMVQRFGAAVRDYLAGVWDHAKRSSQTGALNFTSRLGEQLQQSQQAASRLRNPASRATPAAMASDPGAAQAAAAQIAPPSPAPSALAQQWWASTSRAEARAILEPASLEELKAIAVRMDENPNQSKAKLIDRLVQITGVYADAVGIRGADVIGPRGPMPDYTGQTAAAQQRMREQKAARAQQPKERGLPKAKPRTPEEFARDMAALMTTPGRQTVGTMQNSADLPAATAAPLKAAYASALRGSSTAMVPIRRVYEEAQKQNPALTPEQFLAEVKAADEAGTVFLEPPESAATVAAAGPFVLRNASGIVTTNMMVVPQVQASRNLANKNPGSLSTTGADIRGPKADAVLPAIESFDSFQSAPERPATGEDYNTYLSAQAKRLQERLRLANVQLSAARQAVMDAEKDLSSLNLGMMGMPQGFARDWITQRAAGALDGYRNPYVARAIIDTELLPLLEARSAAAREALIAAEAEVYLAEEAEGGTKDRLAAKQSAAARQRTQNAATFAALLDARDDQAKHASSTFVTRVWKSFAQNDEAFQFGKTTAADADAIAAAVSLPGRQITARQTSDSVRFMGVNGYLDILDADTRTPYIRSSEASSKGKKGGGGTQLYQAALDWIHNNGKRIKDDPGGLTSINAIRRSSNFFSSALRWGTTQHLKPHSKQSVKWSKSDTRNIGALAAREMDHAFKAIAEARNWRYDFNRGIFINAAGQQLALQDIENAVSSANPAESGIGVSTLERAIITASAIEAFQRGEAESVVSEIGSRDGLPDGLTGIFYSQSQSPPVSPSSNLDNGSPTSLFAYDARPEADLTARERDALRVLRGLPEYRNIRITPVTLTGLARGQGVSPRGQDTRAGAITAWGRAFTRLFGKSILFIDGPSDLNGAVAAGQRNVLMVNVNSRDPLLYTLGHELTHSLRAQNPTLYKALEAEVLAGGTDLDAVRQRLIDSGYQANELNEEIVADFVGAQMLEPDFLNRIAQEKPGLFERFARAVVKFINGLLSKTKTFSRDIRPHFQQNLEALRDQLAKALRTYAESGQFPDSPLEGDVEADTVVKASRATAETESRFASPNPADRVINGPRTDELVTAEANAWLNSMDQQAAIEAFVAGQVPLSLDTAERAAATLIANLSEQAATAKTEMARMWAHVQGRRMARVWTTEHLSADPARALRQRGVVNNTILAPIAPVLAAQELLEDRAKKVIDQRFDGGTEGAVAKVKDIATKADEQAGTDLAADLEGETTPGAPTRPGQPPRPRKLGAKHPNLKKMLDALRKKMFPGMTWADIFTQLPESQKARQREIYRRLMLDERLRNLTAEERLALTNELDKAWQRERRKVFMRELEKAGVLGEAKPKDREKVKAAAPRLLRLMNLGMLNSEMFREALAKEYGLNMIDAAAAADLRALGERIQKAPEGLPRRKLEQQLVERLQKLTGYTLWQVMDSWWTASVLSGWRTQVDIGLSIANGIEDIGLGSIVAALRSGNKDVAVRGLAALFGRIPSAFMEAVNHIATGNKAMMRNFELEVKQAMEGGNQLASDVGRQMWDKGGWRKVPGGFMVFYGRLMTALDHVNSASTREGAKALALARHPELYEKALRITTADRLAARQQARLEMTGGAPPATQQERIEENARMREILEQGIPAEMLAEATEVGRAAALQGEPTGLGGALLDAVLSAVSIVSRKAESMAKRDGLDLKSRQVLRVLEGAAPLARAITGTKFARTVAHSINRTASYVPGLGAYAVGQQGRTGAFGDILAAKQVIGTLVGIALYLAFDDDDDEKGIEDSWKDKTPQQKAQLYAQEKQPFTIWTRDDQGRVRKWNYQQWGIAGIVNTVAAMLKQKGSEAGTLNVLMSSITQGAMSFTDKAQLQGLQTVFGENFRSTDPASGIAASLNKWAAQTVGGVVPRLVKDIDMVASPELRNTSEWWQKWAKEVPMLRQLSSGKRIDILGQDIKLDRGPLSRVTQLGTADPIYRTLGRLNARDVWLPDPSQGVRVVKLRDGTRRNMTPTEKDRYQLLTCAAYRAYLEKEGPALLQMSPEDAQEAVSKATARLRSTAAYQATH